MSLASVTSINTKIGYYLKKISKNFYFITLTCNKHPAVKTVDTDVYQQMLQKLNGVIINYTYELNKCGQLHLHALVYTEKAVYMKEMLKEWKLLFADYHGRIDRLEESDVFFVSAYINKNKKDNVREIYYRIAKFYENIVDYEDMSELADYGFEYNSNTKRFRYIKFDKPQLLFID